MATVTCANHTLFLMDARGRFACVGCGLPPRPEPPKPEPESAPAEGPSAAAVEAEAAEKTEAPESKHRGVGVRTPKGASKVGSRKGKG